MSTYRNNDVFTQLTIDQRHPTFEGDDRVGQAIRVTGSWIELHDIQVRGYNFGINVVSTSDVAISDCLVRDIGSSAATGVGIRLFDSTDCSVENSFVMDAELEGYSIIAGELCQIKKCNAASTSAYGSGSKAGMDFGYLIATTPTLGVKNHEIRNCIFEYINDGQYNGHGYVISSQVGPNYKYANGNHIQNCLSLWDSYGGIHFELRGPKTVNNTIEKCVADKGFTAVGLYGGAHHNLIDRLSTRVTGNGIQLGLCTGPCVQAFNTFQNCDFYVVNEFLFCNIAEAGFKDNLFINCTIAGFTTTGNPGTTDFVHVIDDIDSSANLWLNCILTNLEDFQDDPSYEFSDSFEFRYCCFFNNKIFDLTNGTGDALVSSATCNDLDPGLKDAIGFEVDFHTLAGSPGSINKGTTLNELLSYDLPVWDVINGQHTWGAPIFLHDLDNDFNVYDVDYSGVAARYDVGADENTAGQ